ncbi:hypothetical protein AB0C41_32835 [Micromonospora taraxaci]|uniref:hypothetical protein n=1 Tax=Actinomycetes TaxID=1760 RepID=UPI0034011093
MSGERIVYSGTTVLENIHVKAEVGGYAPLVTIRFERDGCEFNAFLDPHITAQLGQMLIAASCSAGGSALLGENGQ